MANKDSIQQLLGNRKLCAHGMLWLGEQKTPQTRVTIHLLQVLQEQKPAPATVCTSAVRDGEGGGQQLISMLLSVSDILGHSRGFDKEMRAIPNKPA